MSAAGYVYAVGNDELVKIGFSTKPQLRSNKIRSDASLACRLLGYARGTVRQERELHSLLADARENGEWFRRGHRLVEHFLAQIWIPETIGRKRKHPEANSHPLAMWRQANRVTLSSIGREIGMSQCHLSRLENGIFEISAPTAIAIEIATQGAVPRSALRPDLWPSEAA